MSVLILTINKLSPLFILCKIKNFIILFDNRNNLINNCVMSLTVKKVNKNSAAKKAGIKKNDIIHLIDNITMFDFIDVIYSDSLINPDLKIETNGKVRYIKLKKSEFDKIGIEYIEDLYPPEESCNNRCIFCFVDQLPPGMRKTLYIKDDDWRYSVLYGNYITMTNMDDKDFKRIKTRKVSPLYISVHATDSNIRYNLLKNKNADKLMEQLKFLYDNKITFHSQIVLCPNINDGKVLEKSIEDLSNYYPYAKTVSIVPVGLTKYRDNLPEIKAVDKNYANKIIDEIEKTRKKYLKKIDTPFVYIADEFYSKAEKEFPNYEMDDISAQKANGVGLFSDFTEEFFQAVNDLKNIKIDKREVILITGVSSYKKIKSMCEILEKEVDNLKIKVIKVINHHFGESITVSGLLTGKDIINAVGMQNADIVFIPSNSMNYNEEIFLDDMNIKDIEKAVGSCVIMSSDDGYDFVLNLIGRKQV